MLCCTQAVRSQETTQDLPFDSKVRYGKLENGFTYYIRKPEEPSEQVRIHQVFKVGYFQEDPDQLHLAHVLEHIVFANTTGFRDVANFLQQKGLRIGGDFNASTGDDRTDYYETVPASNRQLLYDCIALSAERISQAIMDSASIENGRTTVLAEFGKPVGEKMNRIVSAVKAFSHDALKRYYQDWYRPDLSALMIVGDVDVDSVEAHIRKHFEGIIPRSTRPFVFKEHPAPAPRAAWAADSTDSWDVFSMQIRYRFPSFRLRNAPDYRKLLIAELFNNMMTMRFTNFNKDNVRSGIVYQRQYGLLDEASDAILCNLVLPKGADSKYIGTALEKWLEMQHQLSRFGFTEKELAMAKKVFARSMNRFIAADPSQQIQRFYDHYLMETPLPDPMQLKTLATAWLANITLKDIQKERQAWFAAALKDVSIKGTEWKALSAAEFRKTEQDVKKRKLLPYVDPVVEQAAIIPADEIPSQGSAQLLDKKEVPEYELSELKFANGVSVILKSFDPSPSFQGKLTLEGRRPGGAARYVGDDHLLAVSSGVVMRKSGAGKLNMDELNKVLQQDETSIYPFVSMNEIGFTCETRTEGLELMLQAVRQYIVHPRIDTSFVDEAIDNIASSLGGVPSIYDSINRVYRDAVLLSEVKISKPPAGIQKMNAQRICHQLFSNVNGFTFVISGDFDLAEAESLATRYLGTLPGQSAANVADNMMQPGGDGVVFIDKNEDGKHRADILIFSRVDTALRARVERILLRRVLKAALFDKLRQEMGAVYSVSVNDVQLNEHWGRTVVCLESSYHDVAVLADTAWQEIRKLQQAPCKEGYLQTAISAEIDKFKKEKALFFWKDYFTKQLRYGYRFDELTAWNDVLRSITTSDIMNAAKRYLSVRSVKEVMVPKPGS